MRVLLGMVVVEEREVKIILMVHIGDIYISIM